MAPTALHHCTRHANSNASKIPYCVNISGSIMADTLPTELIERILGFPASVDTRTALAVCLTNRLGRGAGQPVLYHTLDIQDDGSV